MKKRYILPVLLFLLTAVSCSKKFTFVQLCDTQLGMGGYSNDVKRFEQAVKQINKSDADFTLICGDLVHHASDSSFADFLKINNKFKKPSYVAPGNHDIQNIPTDSSLIYYRKNIEKDYYHFSHHNYGFVIINSQLWKTEITSESEKQNVWLQKVIEDFKSKNMPIFVAGHYPLFTLSSNEKEHYFNIPIKKRKELLDLFEKNNVVGYLSGHTHKLTINNYKNIKLVSGETTSKNFDKRPFGYRKWTVSKDSIFYEFVPLELKFN